MCSYLCIPHRILHKVKASLVAQKVKNLSACDVGNPGLIPGLGRSPGKGKGRPLQYRLKNSLAVHGVRNSQT